MSHFFEYHASMALVGSALPGPAGPYANKFYTFLLAAIREADTDNLARLEAAFPGLVAELRQRYQRGGGVLCERDRVLFNNLYPPHDT